MRRAHDLERRASRREEAGSLGAGAAGGRPRQLRIFARTSHAEAPGEGGRGCLWGTLVGGGALTCFDARRGWAARHGTPRVLEGASGRSSRGRPGRSRRMKGRGDGGTAAAAPAGPAPEEEPFPSLVPRSFSPLVRFLPAHPDSGDARGSGDRRAAATRGRQVVVDLQQRTQHGRHTSRSLPNAGKRPRASVAATRGLQRSPPKKKEE